MLMQNQHTYNESTWCGEGVVQRSLHKFSGICILVSPARMIVMVENDVLDSIASHPH